MSRLIFSSIFLLCLLWGRSTAVESSTNATRLSQEEIQFIMQNLSPDETNLARESFSAAPRPIDKQAFEERQQQICRTLKERLAARGVSYSNPSKSKEGDQPKNESQGSSDIEFLIANLTPEEKKGLMSALAMNQGDEAANKAVIAQFKSRLSNRGITPQNTGGKAFQDKRPKINLADYKPIEIPKESDWAPSPSDDRYGKGYYREESKNAQIVRTRVGVWEKINRDGELESKAGYNRHGIIIGPEWTYFTGAGTKQGQVCSIDVYLGRTKGSLFEGVTLEKLETDPNAGPIEALKFFKDGTLSYWKRIESDGRILEQSFIESGLIIYEADTSKDWIIVRKFFKDGSPQEYSKEKLDKSGKGARFEKVWKEDGSGDLAVFAYCDKSTQIRFNLPTRTEDLSKTNKQSIVWHDPKDESKGIREAGYVDSQDQRIGPWVTWNAVGQTTSEGQYKNGKKIGSWNEYEYLATDLNQKTSEKSGRYADDVRIGIWQTLYYAGHPFIEPLTKREKAELDKRRATGIREVQMLRIDAGPLKETNTYADGKIVKTERDFEP